MHWYERACPACAGDLYDDPEERAGLTCLMCGRSFPISMIHRVPVTIDAPTGRWVLLDSTEAALGKVPSSSIHGYRRGRGRAA